MKATQLAVYRDEIRRLHHANDALAASNQILRDALGAVRADCAAEVAQTRAEMAPGFSWPDRDSAARLSARLEELRAEMAGMATRLAKTAAERDKAIEERDYLRRRHAHHNTSGKNVYAEHRSHVNDEIKKVEAELDAELDAEAAGPGEAGTPPNAEGRAGAGCSHSNKPHKKVWHILDRCPHCRVRGRLRQGRALTSLCNDFDDNGMYVRTTAHIGYEYTCRACGEDSRSEFPRVSGTSFGRKALGIIVQLGGKKCVDADIAEIFGDIFGFPTGETTIWNARRAAADLLDPTIHFILEELKKAKFLGIDETPYSVNGESGYVWVVRTDRATLVLAMPTRAGAVIAEHMSELLHIPVTTDGYSPYLTYFKILQRCWAHILRDAEAAYVHADKGDRARYLELYRKLLGIFRDAKRTAARTAGMGGADEATCLEFEGRVMDVVSAYGDHKFATTLAGAAPNLFTFLRYPGMPPTNNDTERDIRDAVVVQRKIRHKFVNSEGMRVFSAIQGFNSTCRKLGLVPWKCMARIAADHTFNILRAGPEMQRASAPWDNTITVRHEACVDGVPVDAPAGGWDADSIARLAAGVPDAEPDAVPDAVPDTIDTADTDRPASLALKPHTNSVAAHGQPSHGAPGILPYHRKPPPTATA